MTKIQVFDVCDEAYSAFSDGLETNDGVLGRIPKGEDVSGLEIKCFIDLIHFKDFYYFGYCFSEPWPGFTCTSNYYSVTELVKGVKDMLQEQREKLSVSITPVLYTISEELDIGKEANIDYHEDNNFKTNSKLMELLAETLTGVIRGLDEGEREEFEMRFYCN